MLIHPMHTNKRVLMWTCLHSIDQSSSNSLKFGRILCFSTVMSFQLMGITFSVAYWMENWSIDLEKSLYTLLQVAATFSVIYPIVIAFCLRRKIAAMLMNLTSIYNAIEDSDSFCILIETNINIEWIWRMYFKIVLIGVPISMVVLAATSVFVCELLFGYFDPNKLYHPFFLRLPWNQHTRFGYFAEICHSIGTTECYFFGNGLFLLMFAGLCLNHSAFYRVFEHSLQKFKNFESNNREIFCHLIEFHNTIKVWFAETTEVYSLIVLFQLICNMLALTSSVFQLDLQIKHIGFESSILLLGGFNGILNLFIYCYFGKLASESYEQMADALYEMDWPNLNVDLQKFILIMIENAQNPIHYHGFRAVILNLETFCTFMNATVTYYMFLKTISSD